MNANDTLDTELLLRTVKALRHQLWLRRRKFSNADHEAMNIAGEAIKELER